MLIKIPTENSVLSLTENTQRYKSLAGFAIFPCGSDIRLRLAICSLGREGICIISHWSEAEYCHIRVQNRSSFASLHEKAVLYEELPISELDVAKE